MSRKKASTVDLPSQEQLQAEIKRVNFKSRYFKILRSTLYALVITAAVSVLIATLFMPVLQIYGASMSPTLTEGDIVVSVKKSDYAAGDVVAFYYSNKVLVKRVIATEFDVVNLRADGTFTVNGKPLDEPYLTEKHVGDATNVEFPYQVPEGGYFVVGDHRRTSIDSRNSSIGCIREDDVVGEILLTIWPFKHFGGVA